MFELPWELPWSGLWPAMFLHLFLPLLLLLLQSYVYPRKQLLLNWNDQALKLKKPKAQFEVASSATSNFGANCKLNGHEAKWMIKRVFTIQPLIYLRYPDEKEMEAELER